MDSKIRNLGNIPPSVYHHAVHTLAGQCLKPLTYAYTHLAYISVRPVYIAVCQTRLFRNTLRRYKIPQPVALKINYLNIPFLHKPFNVEIGKAQGDSDLVAQFPLGNMTVCG